MTGVCIGERRKVVIPSKLGMDISMIPEFGQPQNLNDLGFGKNPRNGVREDQTLYYTVELAGIFRPNPGDTWTTEEGVKITVTHKIDEDKCRLSEPGDKLHQHYKLWLEDHRLVESSYANNQPFLFTLGTKEVLFKRKTTTVT